MAGIIDGSHTSYHKDGNIFRTSPATKKRAQIVKRHFPLSNFHGWFQLGSGMILKSSLEKCPKLKQKHLKYHVVKVDIDKFPSNALNIVADLLGPNQNELLNNTDMAPPKDSEVIEITCSNPWVIVTILGHDHNLLISPYDGEFKGVKCRHFNKRYSASTKGLSYRFEAYEH